MAIMIMTMTRFALLSYLRVYCCIFILLINAHHGAVSAFLSSLPCQRHPQQRRQRQHQHQHQQQSKWNILKNRGRRKSLFRGGDDLGIGIGLGSIDSHNLHRTRKRSRSSAHAWDLHLGRNTYWSVTTNTSTDTAAGTGTITGTGTGTDTTMYMNTNTNMNTNTLEGKEYIITILSDDPKCFLVHNFLSLDECEEYIQRINLEIEAEAEAESADNTENTDNTDNAKNETNKKNDEDGGIRRSSAPQVSLQLSRLWPLPFLCLGAGIPPVLRLFLDNDSTSSTLLSTTTTTTISSSLGITMNDVLSAALPNIGIALFITALSTILITKGMTSYANQYTRTSQSLALNQEHDVQFIRNLVDRASEVVLVVTDSDDDDANQKKKKREFSWKQWEAPVITKYDEGALFSSHNDASPTRGSEWSDLGGQRIATVISYLNTCPSGGGTKFDALNFVVQPKAGDALVFYPSDWDTLEADGRTVHQSLPAVEEKYIVQLFGRCGRVPPPLGIPDSFGL